MDPQASGRDPDLGPLAGEVVEEVAELRRVARAEEVDIRSRRCRSRRCTGKLRETRMHKKWTSSRRIQRRRRCGGVLQRLPRWEQRNPEAMKQSTSARQPRGDDEVSSAGSDLGVVAPDPVVMRPSKDEADPARVRPGDTMATAGDVGSNRR